MQTPKYMIATTAIHKLGDISRPGSDLCVVKSETEKNYIGNWVTGLGYIGVRFPKSSTRELTEEDIKKYDGRRLIICSMLSGDKSYDCGQIGIKEETILA